VHLGTQIDTRQKKSLPVHLQTQIDTAKTKNVFGKKKILTCPSSDTN
jgi:hypothetical protein